MNNLLLLFAASYPPPLGDDDDAVYGPTNEFRTLLDIHSFHLAREIDVGMIGTIVAYSSRYTTTSRP